MRHSYIFKESHGGKSNPFRLPVGHRRARHPYVLAAIIAALGIFAFYWLFISAAFAIRRVEIQTQLILPADAIKNIIADNLNRRRWRIVSQNNLWAFDARKMEQHIRDLLAIQLITVRRARPDTIRVSIAEQSRRAIANLRGVNYALDARGVVLGRPYFAAAQEAVIYIKTGDAPRKGDTLIDAPDLQFISDLRAQPFFGRFMPEILSIERAGHHDLSVKVAEGWHLRFNMTHPVREQIENLELTLRNSISPDNYARIDYIDLRFDEKVYFKYLD